MADGDHITDLGSGESWGQMGWEVVMSLLESVVLLDVVQVISSQDDGSAHFVREDDTLEDSASDGHVRGEWALVINVVAFDGGSWGLEACKTMRYYSLLTETDLLVESGAGDGLLSKNFLGVLENAELLLESFFSLKGGKGGI